MGIGDRLWDALTQVIKMNDQVTGLSAQVRDLAAELRELDRRMLRLETMVEIALAGKAQGPGTGPQRRLPPTKASKD